MICENGKAAVEVAREWMDAAARCDLAAVSDGMAEDCRRFGEPTWMVLNKADYIAAYSGFLHSFSDYRLEIVNMMADGGTVVFEMIESATLSGPYGLPDGRVIPPSGQSYIDRVCTWLEVGKSGLITEIRAYIPSTRGSLIADAIARAA